MRCNWELDVKVDKLIDLGQCNNLVINSIDFDLAVSLRNYIEETLRVEIIKFVHGKLFDGRIHKVVGYCHFFIYEESLTRKGFTNGTLLETLNTWLKENYVS